MHEVEEPCHINQCRLPLLRQRLPSLPVTWLVSALAGLQVCSRSMSLKPFDSRLSARVIHHNRNQSLRNSHHFETTIFHHLPTYLSFAPTSSRLPLLSFDPRLLYHLILFSRSPQTAQRPSRSLRFFTRYPLPPSFLRSSLLTIPSLRLSLLLT